MVPNATTTSKILSTVTRKVEAYNKIVRDEFLAGEDISMSQIA